MQEVNNTQYFKVQKDQDIEVKDVVEQVYRALIEKGYNPVNQIVGYIMSGDQPQGRKKFDPPCGA